MTKKQRLEHKLGNQIRKKIILKYNAAFAYGGVIQNGKYSHIVSIKE